MGINEVSQLYNIPMSTLRYYEKEGLLSSITQVNGKREYGEDDLKQLSLVMSLVNLGMPLQKVKVYLSSSQNERVNLLRCHRCDMLEDIHQLNQKLDQLDYMVYEMKEKTNEK